MLPIGTFHTRNSRREQSKENMSKAKIGIRYHNLQIKQFLLKKDKKTKKITPFSKNFQFQFF